MPLLSSGNSRPQTGGGSQDANGAPQATAAPTLLNPFVRASDENVQFANLDRTSAVLGANVQDFGVTNIPAYGYLSHLYILVEATGGAGTGAVAVEDGPWTVLRDVALTEPNGAVIATFNTGYDLYLANKYGGYNHPVSADPKASPVYSAVAANGNFRFLLRLPVSVSFRDAVGSLANQDSAGEFKLRLKVGTAANVYSTPPSTTNPTVQVRAWMQAWDQPEPVAGGMANETEPPGHGTTSMWTSQTGIVVNAGETTITINRKGNYLRQLIFVLRRAGTSRANGQSDWPNETRFERDAFPSRYLNDLVWQNWLYERTGYDNTADAKKGPENGVRFLDYMHEFDGTLGGENRDMWQVTRSSTRLELKGQFKNAGLLDIIINDVAVAQSGVFL